MKKHQLFVIALLFMAQTGLATNYCVTTSSQLHDALASAQINNQHDHIKIAEGYYLTTTGTNFTYTESAGWDLEISGGWTEFFGNTCGQQLSGSPWNTVLDGNHTKQIMNISSGGNSDIVIRNLTFLNGGYDSLSSGGGLRFWGITAAGHTGQVIIERNVFINNRAKNASALDFFSSGAKSYIRNNVFTLNETFDGSYAVDINQDLNSGIYFTNNTVFNNKGDSTNNRGGLRIYTTLSSKALVANNILYDNGNRDLNISGSVSAGDVYLKTNNIGIVWSAFPPSESIGNISVPPQFVPGFNYTPASYSQLLNRGTHPYVCIVGNVCIFPVPFDKAWSMGEVDTEGNIRVQHGRIDIGAIESPYQSELIFINGFE